MPLSTSTRRFRRVLGTALTGALCFSIAAATADAAPVDTSIVTTTTSGIKIMETPETQQTCTAPRVVSAFAGFGDLRDYVLAPGGSFETKGLAGWQVQKAQNEGGGSPLHVGRDENKQALKVPAGGSATSPAMCVDLHYPTMRLMAKAQKNKGQLKVEVIYPDSNNPVFQPVGSLTAGSSDKWLASGDMPVYPERGGATAGMRRVALRFTSIAAPNGEVGEWRIDDLYVDPKRL